MKDKLKKRPVDSTQFVKLPSKFTKMSGVGRQHSPRIICKEFRRLALKPLRILWSTSIPMQAAKVRKMELERDARQAWSLRGVTRVSHEARSMTPEHMLGLRWLSNLGIFC